MVNHYASGNDGERPRGGARCSVIKYSSLGKRAGRGQTKRERVNVTAKVNRSHGGENTEGVEEVEAPLALQ